MKKYKLEKKGMKKLSKNILIANGLKEMYNRKIYHCGAISYLGILLLQSIYDFKDDEVTLIIKSIPYTLWSGEIVLDIIDTIRQRNSDKKLKILCDKLNNAGIKLKKDDLSILNYKDKDVNLNIILKYQRSIKLEENTIKFVDNNEKQTDITDLVNSTFLSKSAYKKYLRNRQNS